jgi:hypothetical protein
MRSYAPAPDSAATSSSCCCPGTIGEEAIVVAERIQEKVGALALPEYPRRVAVSMAPCSRRCSTMRSDNSGNAARTIFSRSTFLARRFVLRLQRAKEKENPLLPVWGICPDRHLGLANGEILTFLALFDLAFERTIRVVGVPPAHPTSIRHRPTLPRGIDAACIYRARLERVTRYHVPASLCFGALVVRRTGPTNSHQKLPPNDSWAHLCLKANSV